MAVLLLEKFCLLTLKITNNNNNNDDWRMIIHSKFIYPDNEISLPHDTFISGGGGTQATHNILALQTPLHDVTCGSGCNVKTHTWPT